LVASASIPLLAGLRRDCGLAAATHPTYPSAELLRTHMQVCQAATDGAAGNSGCLRHRRHAASTRGARLNRSEQPSSSLVEERRKSIETDLDGGGVDHNRRLGPSADASHQFPDSFIAFLPTRRFFPSDSVARAQALSPHYS
jgi:hypothetical protein